MQQKNQPELRPGDHTFNLIKSIVEKGGRATAAALSKEMETKKSKQPDYVHNANWYLKAKPTKNYPHRDYGKYFCHDENDDTWSLSDEGQKYYDAYIKPNHEYTANDPNAIGEIDLVVNSIAKPNIKIGDLDVVDMLIKSHNIILHGAPGTGKTYLAQVIASVMGATKDNGQFEMVQFHPSYDYTDFVEGLRPTDKNEKGEVIKDIHFVRTDGAFKGFCKKAVPITALRKTWEELIANKSDVEITLRGGDNIRITEKYKDKVSVTTTEGDKNAHEVYWDTIYKIASKFPNKNSLEQIKNIDKEIREVVKCDTSKHYAVLNYLYETMDKKDYVFLIDEINRGDMSKIFGELFFSIDPGYRVKKGEENEAIMITTQYQNLIDKNGTDPFKDGFYIPDNVYIIGTMNDIDRSVESMDFAMRRRFQFIEITAESRAEGMGLVKKDADGKITTTKAYDRMTNLNNCISGKIEDGGIGLSSAYHIGGSYFLSEEKDDKGQRKPIEDNDYQGFKNLWNYRLKGLLREYLRGEDESIADEKLTKLENAFKNPERYKYDKDGKLTVVEKKSEEAATQQNGDSPENSTKAE